MKKFTSLILATGFSFVASTAAFAGLLSIDTTTDSLAGYLPLGAAHDVTVTQGATGWYNANLTATQDVTLTYEYLGFEAGWTNTFLVDNSQAFWNKAFNANSASTAGDTAGSSASAGALLDFAFDILVGGNAGYGVVNGANNYPIDTYNNVTGLGLPNFFLGYVDSTENSVYITLDDGGGDPWTNTSIDDDNHDDMVVKVTAFAATIPEPSTIAIMAFGLALLGFNRRKRLH